MRGCTSDSGASTAPLLGQSCLNHMSQANGSNPSSAKTPSSASVACWAIVVMLVANWLHTRSDTSLELPQGLNSALDTAVVVPLVNEAREAEVTPAGSVPDTSVFDHQVVPAEYEGATAESLPAPVLASPQLAEPRPTAADAEIVSAAPDPQSGSGASRIVVPLAKESAVEGTIEANGELVSIAVREAPLHAVLSLLARQQGLSIVASSELNQPITVTLQPTTLDNALDALLSIADCTWARRNDVIYVTSLTRSEQATPSPFFQGRELRVYQLNYAAAADVERVVAGLLSSVGSVYVRQFDSQNQRKTAEQLIVEDLPPFLERIEQYLSQADVCPRQVLIEARILQVRLGKDDAHGVNFDALARVSGAQIQVAGSGFASDTGPGMVFTIDGTDYNSLIDCLTTTTDSKTLAAPKVFALNGQQARIQIGERLGYFVTTTTQTATVQNVDFLEVGVVLDVIPQITNDGQVLMQVLPKVSTGDINPATGLPDEETTEVSTSVLVPDGHGVIIGGLIQEEDIDRQSKLGPLGNVWGVGRLFQRRTLDRERQEVIVALRPRIVDCGSCLEPPESVQVARSQAPLLTPGVQPAHRPWEPSLPDASDRPAWSWRRRQRCEATPTEVLLPEQAPSTDPCPPPESVELLPSSSPVVRLPPVETN